MNKVFDWLREQIGNLSINDIDVLQDAVLEKIDEAEAKCDEECCIWDGFDNSLTEGKTEWTYKITCQSQPRYIPEDYMDSLWTRCPYCGRFIKISGVE